MGVESDWDSDGDETDGEREVKEIKDLGSAGHEFSGPYQAAEKNVSGRERQREPGSVIFSDFVDDDIGFEKVDTSIYEGQDCRNGSQDGIFTVRLQREQRSDGEDREKQRGIGEGDGELAAVVESPIPAKIEDQRAGITHDQQAPPRLEDYQD